jgi:putative DNA primase/helicase
VTTPDEARDRLAREYGVLPDVPESDDVNGSYHDIPEDHEFTDVGMAERFAVQHGANVRYVRAWNRWLYFDGCRWADNDVGEIEQLVVDTVSTLYADAVSASQQGNEFRVNQLHAAAKKYRNVRHLKSLLEAARTLPGVAVRPEDFDRHPYLLNVANGTVDLRTGDLSPHRPEDLITKIAQQEYRPDAECPLFERFLSEVFNGDAELIHFVKRAVGYSAIGGTQERILLILWGIGKNGKSTLIEVLSDAFGDYAKTTPVQTLLSRRSEIPNDVAALKGARFVHASESPEGRRLNESLVKAMTGNDTLSARFMRAEWFEFKPEFTIWLATNNKPRIEDPSEATWDRIRLIPFQVRFGERGAPEVDKDLPAKLQDELPGILRWIVEGAVEYQEYGLVPPDAVLAATEAYRTEQDALAEFLDECCVIKPDAWCSSSAAWTAYEAYLGKSARLIRTEFSKAMTARGFKQVRGRENGRQQRGYKGVGIVSDRQQEGMTDQDRLDVEDALSSERL